MFTFAGSRLRQLRLDRKLTLSHLARAAGVQRSTLSMIETGKRQPSLALAVSLARALGVPVGDLLAADPPPLPPAPGLHDYLRAHAAQLAAMTTEQRVHLVLYFLRDHLNRQGLAQALGISVAGLDAILLGQTEPPPALVERLATATGLGLDFFHWGKVPDGAAACADTGP